MGTSLSCELVPIFLEKNYENFKKHIDKSQCILYDGDIKKN